MKLIAIGFIYSLLIGCASNTPFYQVSCEYLREDIFEVRFKNTEDLRRLTLNPKHNNIFFKGTTFRDLKWANDLDKMDFFNVNEEGSFQVTQKAGFVQEFGFVEAECLEELKLVLGDSFVTTN